MKNVLTMLASIAAGLALVLAVSRLANAQSGIYSPGAIPLNNTPPVLVYSSWANGPSGHIDFAKSPLQYTITAASAVTGFDNQPAAGTESTVVSWWTNSTAGDLTVYITASGYTASDGSRSFIVTNKSQRCMAFLKNDLGVHGQGTPFY